MTSYSEREDETKRGCKEASSQTTGLDLAIGSKLAPKTSLFKRRLMAWDEVLGLLNVDADDLRKLTETGQLTPIRIAGKERFDSLDIDGLIETYKQTARRRAASV